MEKIIVDLYGGDNPVDILIKGAVRALLDRPELYLVFVGPSAELSALLGKEPELSGRYEIVDCPDYLTNDINPVVAIRSGKEYTLIKGAELLASGDAKAYVSIGSTGALIISALIKVGLKENSQKPVLAALLPADNKGGRFLLCDCGSNLAPSADDYFQYALLGSEYLINTGRCSAPRVAMINVGAEKGKGTPEMNAAYDMLSTSELNFVGNIEPDHIFEGGADVYICSGLAGNALIKGIEANGYFLMKNLTESLDYNCDDETRALIDSRINDLGALYKYNDLGGAIILGIKKPIFKAHGKAVDSTIYNCLLQTLGC